MAGLYIHIPFCASRCIYCAFYSTTSLKQIDLYVNMLCKEMELRRNEVDTIQTIYIGGGTPSLLSPQNLTQIFSQIATSFNLSKNTEITIECNPDDITPSFVDTLSALPVNRVSMGVQTFDNNRLRFLHRRHSQQDVYNAVEYLQKANICNISIDLIFGFPNESLSDWEADIDKALSLNIQHISAYSLTYEENTVLNKLKACGSVSEIEEEISIKMFQKLIQRLKDAGFEHYEISNFAKRITRADGTTFSHRSRHNSSYWHAVPYLGIGAAAHSYNGTIRKWNVANLKTYIDSINQSILPYEMESLNVETQYNDCITTTLRTKEGIDLGLLNKKYGKHLYQYLLHESEQYLNRGLLVMHNNHLALSQQGIFVCDMIMADLMYV